jgi:hypothetical protein
LLLGSLLLLFLCFILFLFKLPLCFFFLFTLSF